ncbi:M18 family aminopeptidase [Dialister sp.]|uniref:M18 family aminopeptidase n=1 Tax=Dialister sp. TaxID=1955814 RepID=UPI002E81BE8F|nr:M18 family aminopeptidase [Dialister sp.]MEE3452402.1 M18 family aminopeptidase [Dialister sp.]
MALQKPESPEEVSGDLLHFIARSPSTFHAVRGMKAALLYAGFREIREEDEWHIEKGGKYVVTRNGSALIAFSVPEEGGENFHVVAAHCDSPTFKIKENPEIKAGAYTKLNVEAYGGMIMSTWLDRPLSVAGRLIVRENGHLAEKLVAIDGTMLVIPSVAIHMDRNVNHKKDWNVQTDLLPLYGLSSGKTPFMDVIAASAKVKSEDILAHDLYLYSRVPGTIWGEEREFISSPKLDDLQCAFAAFRGYTMGKKEKTIAVYALFDNEEVGSETARGAGSPFLATVLTRLSLSLGNTYDQTMAMMARSFMISADNAHSIHPNHPEYADPVNQPVINGGIVIKYSARQSYATDAFSAAYFKDLCGKFDIPTQIFTNRSDNPGGSTLGNISSTKVSMPTVDIGLPMLAMHSSWETAGVKDTENLVHVICEFFA